MRKMALAAATSLALVACDGISADFGGDRQERALSGEQSQRSVALDGFDEVELHGPERVEIAVGDDFAIRAEGDRAILDILEFDVRDGELRIEREDNSWFGSGPDGRATVYVTMPAIRGATIAGSGTMTVDRAEAESFEVDIAGSGDLEIAALAAGETEFNIAGSGSVRAAGISNAIEVDIAGSGDVEIGELQAERMEVNIAGSGDVDAYVTERVEASFLGSGDVRVRGGAQCQSNSMGSGTLTCD